MKSKDKTLQKEKLFKGLDKVDNNTDIENILELISEFASDISSDFSEINLRYNPDINPCYRKIQNAVNIFKTHKKFGISLTKLIEDYAQHMEKQRLKKKPMPYNHGLKQRADCSDLVHRIIQIARESNYIIPRAYSDFDLFNPRLFIIGYENEAKEKKGIRRLIDIIPDSIIAVDHLQGSESTKPHPSIEKYDGLEILGIDDTTLIKAERKHKYNKKRKIYLPMAEKRLHQAIVPNTVRIYGSNPYHNIVCLLGADAVLQQHALYRELEKQEIPYIAIFPGFGHPHILKELHRYRLHRLAEARFDKERSDFPGSL